MRVAGPGREPAWREEVRPRATRTADLEAGGPGPRLLAWGKGGPRWGPAGRGEVQRRAARQADPEGPTGPEVMARERPAKLKRAELDGEHLAVRIAGPAPWARAAPAERRPCSPCSGGACPPTTAGATAVRRETGPGLPLNARVPRVVTAPRWLRDLMGPRRRSPPDDGG